MTFLPSNTTRLAGKHLYFEVCRGMDKSFGFNQFSRPETILQLTKCGNHRRSRSKRPVAANVGPDSLGRIPDYQVKILEGEEGMRIFANTDKQENKIGAAG